MARTATAHRAPDPHTVTPEEFDRWRAARTQPAHSVVGYTPIEQLQEDFETWGVAALNLDGGVDPDSFRAAFDNAPKPTIHFETLQCRAFYQRPRMAECVSLSLRAPIAMAEAPRRPIIAPVR